MQEHASKLNLAAIDSSTPILSDAQAQGDLLVEPVALASGVRWCEVPIDGLQLMRRSTSPNSHWIVRDLASPGVRWAEGSRAGEVAFLRVPEGDCVWLVHTEEHHALGIGPGDYVIRRKRQQAFATEVNRIVPGSSESAAPEWVED